MRLIQSQLKLSTSEVAVLPVHGLSAKTGQGTQELLPAAMQLYDVWNKRIPTSRLNSWREKVTCLQNFTPPRGLTRIACVQLLTLPEPVL